MTPPGSLMLKPSFGDGDFSEILGDGDLPEILGDGVFSASSFGDFGFSVMPLGDLGFSAVAWRFNFSGVPAVRRCGEDREGPMREGEEVEREAVITAEEMVRRREGEGWGEARVGFRFRESDFGRE